MIRTARFLVAAGVVVAAAIALTGCGGGTKTLSASEDDAYRSAVEAQEGQPVADWPKYKKVGQNICASDESEFGMSLAVFTDDGNLEAFKMMVRHQCPNRVPEISKSQHSTDWIREACAVAPADRTQKQKDAAEAMAC